MRFEGFDRESAVWGGVLRRKAGRHGRLRHTSSEPLLFGFGGYSTFTIHTEAESPPS